MELNNLGFKQTKNRKKILDILDNSKDSLSAEDIYRQLMDDGINLSTVYRTLSSFCEKGIVNKEVRQDGKSIYNIIKTHHHHVLICTKCNKRVYLEKCPYKTIEEEIYRTTGFKLQNHNMELYGLCKECQESNK